MSKQLPRGWKEFALKDIGNFLRGSGISKKDFSDTGIPAIRYGDIYTKYDFVIKNVSSFTNSKGTELKKGDILFAGSGETAEEIGKSVAFIDDYKAFAGGDIIIFRPNIDLNSLFLSYILNSGKCRKDISIMGQGHTVVHIYASSLEILKVILPPLDEQKRIADILSTFDDLIENLNKLIEKKEIYKKGVMQRVLTGEVRFNSFTDEWETVRLGDIATITSAGVDKKINDNETKVRLLNYLDVFNRNKLYDNEISFVTSANENQIKKCDIKKGDLFITPSSEDREGIAKSAVAMEDFTNVVYSYHIIRLRFNREIDLKFKSYMCDTALFHRQAYRLCDGSGQRYVISLGTFREMEIYIPKSIEEQKKIGELLSLIDKDIDNLKKMLQLRKLQKKGVMQKLLTGEVRI